ncbi:MAG TPA: phospholipid carrier-dependent glycosyltransferase [Pyrinomonadaceae bacterium]|jgi:4-amino-4-deoxy-L-arabinose transferase-like glycosyltransferase
MLKHARVWPLLLFAAVIVFYFYGLGSLPLVGPDEPRYAQVAREMFDRGDMVTPTLGGRTWFEKPALLYWMMMGGYKLFGVSAWAARLGPALCGLLTVFLIYWVGRRVERAEGNENGPGPWGAVALASSAGLVVFSRAASFDVVVTATTTLALSCFLVAELETGRKRRLRLLAAFHAAVGLSLLAKGLVGIVIPFGVVGLYQLLRREWPRKCFLSSLLWGVPLALAIAGLWYGPVIARHGWTFVDQFFIQHHFARFISNQYRHPQRFYFYLPIMLMLTLPWTALLLVAVAQARRWRWREPTAEGRARVFALAWLAAPVLFFSISQSKLPGYVLPALPGAMLLAGFWLSRFMRGESGNGVMRATGALLLVMAAGGIAYALRTEEVTLACALGAVAPLVIAGALAILWRERRALRVELICGAMFISIALVLNCAAGRLGHRESVRDLMRLADTRGLAALPVFYMLTDDRTGEFYAGGRLAYRADGEPFRFDGAQEVAAAARERGGTALVLVPVEWTNQLTDYRAVETEIIGDNGVLTLALIRVR